MEMPLRYGGRSSWAVVWVVVVLDFVARLSKAAESSVALASSCTPARTLSVVFIGFGLVVIGRDVYITGTVYEDAVAPALTAEPLMLTSPLPVLNSTPLPRFPIRNPWLSCCMRGGLMLDAGTERS